MKKLVIILLFAVSIAVFGSRPGDFVRGIPIPALSFTIPAVEKTTNGAVRYYFFPKEEIPLTSLEISFYGSYDSLKDQPKEIPELLTHVLLYGGSTKHPGASLLSELEKIGARLNISQEYRKVNLTLSFLTEDTEQVLQLLAELLQHPALPAEAVVSGKKKLKEEIERRNERTEQIGFRKTRELLLKDYNAGKSYSKESVDSITDKQLSDFFSFLLQGTSKAVLLHGKYDKKKTTSFLDSLLAAQKEFPGYAAEEIDYAKLKESAAAIGKNYFVEKEVNQSMVMLSGILPPHNHPDFYAATVLNYILGGGSFNSYFMKIIRSEKGLAYTAVSYPSYNRDFGVLYCYALTKAESTAEVLQLMREILDEKTVAAISQTELDDAKNAIINKFIFLFNEDSEVIRNTLRFDEDEMPEGYLENFRKNIGLVSRTDLLRVSKYFLSKNLKTVIVVRKDVKPEGFVSVDPEQDIGAL